MKQKNKILIACSIVIIVLLGLFINTKFFFNPILYKKDNITYLPYSWYTNPMSIEYNSLDLNSPDGWKTIIIKDKKEIRFVIDELKRGEQILESKPINPNILNEIIIRPSNGSVVLDVFIYTNKKIARVNSTSTFKRLTNKLTELINKRMKEAK